MRLYHQIVLARLGGACRRIALRLGLRLKQLSKRLILFGGEKTERTWGVGLFSRIFGAEIEIVGSGSRVYRGRICSARFRTGCRSAKRVVVIHLNWIATRDAPFGALSTAPWAFGGPCTIVVDPDASPLHDADGTLWFMLPNGYGAIRFDPKEFLCFAGPPDTPRVYEYF